MDKIIEGIKSFLSTGNNLTIVIVIAVLVLALVIAMITASIKKKKVEKKVAEEEALAQEEEAEEQKPLAIETITLSPIVEDDTKKEESGAILVNSATSFWVSLSFDIEAFFPILFSLLSTISKSDNINSTLIISMSLIGSTPPST